MPWVGRASGLDDPGDGLGGFGDHVAGLVLVARGHLLQNVAIGLLDEHVGHCVANAAADLGYGDPRGNACDPRAGLRVGLVAPTATER